MKKKPPFRGQPKLLAKKWRQLRPLLSSGRWLATESKSPVRLRHIETQSQINQDQIRILTFNIQAGLNSQAYSDYVKSSLSQFLPSEPNIPHISAIGDLIKDYDLIGLQELDAGSHRSGHINQLSFLAAHGEFEFCHQQLNRNLGRFGQYSNGILSRFTPFQVEDHKLPGLPGRGAIIAKYKFKESSIAVCCVHLALSEKAQMKQLKFLKELLEHEEHVVLMGDMNCIAQQLEQSPLQELSLTFPELKLNSFPSWDPSRNIDHILVSQSLKVSHVEVVQSTLSDHCPVAMTIELK